MSQAEFKQHQSDIAQSVRVINQRAEAAYALYDAAMREQDALRRQLRAKDEVITNYDKEWQRRKDQPLAYGVTRVTLEDEIQRLNRELKKFKDYGRLKDLAKIKVEKARDAALQKVKRWDELQAENFRLRVDNENLSKMNTTQAEAYQALEKRVITNQSVSKQMQDDLVTAGLFRALELKLEKAEAKVAAEQRLRLQAEGSLTELSDQLATIRDAVKHPALYSRTSAW